MDNIDKVISYAETGIRPSVIAEDEPTEIYDAVDDLKALDCYKFLQWYSAAYEYRRSKMMRTTQHQTTDGVSITY